MSESGGEQTEITFWPVLREAIVNSWRNEGVGGKLLVGMLAACLVALVGLVAVFLGVLLL